MPDLHGKRIVVTGASAGIGAELARQLARAGCRLVLTARRGELLDKVCAESRSAGVQAGHAGTAAHPVICDVTSRAEVFRLAAEATRLLGGIDCWVSNAGGGIMHKVVEATEEDMLWQFRLNCLSSLWAYQALVPGWLAAGFPGQIVDIASVGSKAAFPLSAGYVTAKAGLSNLGDCLRLELAGTSVVITTVYPGTTVSDFSAVRPDRTGGQGVSAMQALRRSRHWLASRISRQQSTAYVAQRIARCIGRRVYTCYPHRWAAFAALVYNLWPGWVLGQFAKKIRAT